MKNENKLIAEFMGYELLDGTDGNCYRQQGGWEILMIDDGNGNTDFPYDTDWNRLMPVVIKCFATVDEYSYDDINFKLNDALLETNIDTLYRGVVELINKYNEDNQLEENKNKLIAEFMELPTEVFKQSKTRHYFMTEFNSGSWYEEEELSYDVSWDWLMPVVYKIKWLEDLEVECYEDIDNGLTNALLPQTYDAVVEFINKYIEE
jgi:hypothetical protein